MDMLKKVTGIFIDLIGICITPAVAAVSAIQARLGSKKLPLTYKIWDLFKITPVSHHYYQPVFNVNELPESIWQEKDPLYGIALNTEGQVALLRLFNYDEELKNIPVDQSQESLSYYYHNYSFGPGDAETLYNVVRYFKPKKVIEIGSGYSTRLMKKALDKNRSEGAPSSHRCIEPYEMPWLEKLDLTGVIRSKVEDVGLSLFGELEDNDILFIDSSHVLRMGGDVFIEYLHILPTLKKGVIIHIHDIFIPYEYPKDWVVNQRKFFTEQYLLQAFLAFNSDFEVLLACNYLAHSYPKEFSAASPMYAKTRAYTPGSFWMRRKR